MQKRFRLVITGIAVVTALSACSSEESATNAEATSTTSTSSATAVDGSPVPTSAAADEVAETVEVKDMAFEPATVTIDAGEVVKWEFKDGGVPHAVQGLGDSGMELSSPILKSGSYSHGFATPGTYDYICPLHPEMRATVIVR
ncbi:cupredoxin domain-containing protein [Aldersonia sp. NBC_00410]|uniref:cupredoxin domain-containing protein n=1 Tax=Aldersonia sp. NBC_00410 TaxID=2975954 RepID=UPI00225AABC8|nr:cupredoxin domain-containing protein [Aldersonia sp. NBC_00410]MCX5043911.1 cupredoxin domain-containing protein [Aldersonia sp. NBC_00410]